MIWLSVKRDVFMQNFQKSEFGKFHFYTRSFGGGITTSFCQILTVGMSCRKLHSGGCCKLNNLLKNLGTKGTGTSVLVPFFRADYWRIDGDNRPLHETGF